MKKWMKRLRKMGILTGFLLGAATAGAIAIGVKKCGGDKKEKKEEELSEPEEKTEEQVEAEKEREKEEEKMIQQALSQYQKQNPPSEFLDWEDD